MPIQIRQKLGQLWASISHLNTVLDLLELLGWKTFMFGILSSLGIYGWLWEPGNRPLAVIAALLAGICVCFISIALQLKQGVKSNEKPKEEIQESIPYTFPAEHKEIREKILLVLKDDFPAVLTTLVAAHLSIDKTLAHYHLEELLDAKMVECFPPGIMNNSWENTWCIAQRGRAYLVSHGLLK